MCVISRYQVGTLGCGCYERCATAPSPWQVERANGVIIIAIIIHKKSRRSPAYAHRCRLSALWHVVIMWHCGQLPTHAARAHQALHSVWRLKDELGLYEMMAHHSGSAQWQGRGGEVRGGASGASKQLSTHTRLRRDVLDFSQSSSYMRYAWRHQQSAASHMLPGRPAISTPQTPLRCHHYHHAG